jgi:hypothetical protein
LSREAPLVAVRDVTGKRERRTEDGQRNITEKITNQRQGASTMKTSTSKIIMATFLAALPVTSALAAEPEASITATASAPASPLLSEESSASLDILTADAAEARAHHYRELARRFRALGGVGYKSGLVQRAEASAAEHAMLAAELRGPASTEAPRSPEAERYAKLAEQYRRFGGVAYKAGLVQWAEAQQRKHEPAAMAAADGARAPDQSCRSSKPVVCFLTR